MDIKCFKGNFYNPAIDQIDPRLYRSSEYDVRIVDEKSQKERFYRVRYHYGGRGYYFYEPISPCKLYRETECKLSNLNFELINDFLLPYFGEELMEIFYSEENQLTEADKIPYFNGQLMLLLQADIGPIRTVKKDLKHTVFTKDYPIYYQRYLVNDVFFVDVEADNTEYFYTVINKYVQEEKIRKFGLECRRLSKKSPSKVPWKLIKIIVQGTSSEEKAIHTVQRLCEISAEEVEKFKKDVILFGRNKACLRLLGTCYKEISHYFRFSRYNMELLNKFILSKAAK